MTVKRLNLVALGLLGFVGPATGLLAEDAKHPMSFFVTSAGRGDGANLGGLAGADEHCQDLAKQAGRGDVTWHAYLSTQGPHAINARDRIGKGPWYNYRGELIASDLAVLNGDTAELARIGNALGKHFSVTEKGEIVNGSGDTPNRHDILTGSHSDGTAYAESDGDHTCHNWTSDNEGAAQLGHNDKQGGGNASWNSAHLSKGCSQAALVSTGGVGLLYCFAVYL